MNGVCVIRVEVSSEGTSHQKDNTKLGKNEVSRKWDRTSLNNNKVQKKKKRQRQQTLPSEDTLLRKIEAMLRINENNPLLLKSQELSTLTQQHLHTLQQTQNEKRELQHAIIAIQKDFLYNVAVCEDKEKMILTQRERIHRQEKEIEDGYANSSANHKRE